MPPLPPPSDIETALWRAEELDALDAILPFDRRDQLASILTDDDVATLKHLAVRGMGANTLRALASDLAYIERWCGAATGSPLPWPAPESLLLKFVAHHLWDPAERAADASHGMPDHVEQTPRDVRLLKSTSPHAPATVRRRLTSWSTLTRWRGLDGAFSSPSLKSALRIASGPVFRKIDQWGNVGRLPLSPQSVNLIVKSRCARAGLDPARFSAHGLRSGYLTEAANRGVPLQEAMQQSQHKSMAQAAAYYNEQDRKRGRAARLFT